MRKNQRLEELVKLVDRAGILSVEEIFGNSLSDVTILLHNIGFILSGTPYILGMRVSFIILSPKENFKNFQATFCCEI